MNGRTLEYKAYLAARGRCNNPTHWKYANYGGRGIEFKFAGYPEFLAAVGRKPGPEYSLDRIDNSGHYEPGNVRWADQKTQANNRRKRRTGYTRRKKQVAA